MAKNILKEAIADAKAVREVALQNAKNALEEAFTPKLQSMLSSKLQEELDEDMYYDEDEDGMEEMMYDEDEDGMEEKMIRKPKHLEKGVSGSDDEIDLEEILNELELEEGEGADEEDEEDLEEAVGYPNYRADQVQKVIHNAEDINQSLNENADFDLDSLLKEINDLEDNKEINLSEIKMPKGKARRGMRVNRPQRTVNRALKTRIAENKKRQSIKKGCYEKVSEINSLKSQLSETKKAFTKVKGELNEVNLLNSKLLYVNRIFKANHLDDSQKLRVVETLDKAGSTKEAKLIYETIKDTFRVANSKKVSSKNKARSLKENFKGIASKSTGQSTAPRKAIISESDNMINRFQKLANIKINQ
jgi:hypothetical protein